MPPAQIEFLPHRRRDRSEVTGGVPDNRAGHGISFVGGLDHHTRERGHTRGIQPPRSTREIQRPFNPQRFDESFREGSLRPATIVSAKRDGQRLAPKIESAPCVVDNVSPTTCSGLLIFLVPAPGDGSRARDDDHARATEERAIERDRGVRVHVNLEGRSQGLEGIPKLSLQFRVFKPRDTRDDNVRRFSGRSLADRPRDLRCRRTGSDVMRITWSSCSASDGSAILPSRQRPGMSRSRVDTDKECQRTAPRTAA